jgi:hypothetical protein
MTLEEYRTEVVERLWACQQPAQARALLFEVECALTADHLSDRTLRTFWQSLSGDLEVLARGSAHILDMRALAVLDAVIAASQAAIAQFQAQVVSDEPAEGGSKTPG